MTEACMLPSVFLRKTRLGGAMVSLSELKRNSEHETGLNPQCDVVMVLQYCSQVLRLMCIERG